MQEQLISFETAKLAKEKGFCNGSDGCYFQFTEDYIYDDDSNHPESYKKDEIRFYEFFHRNDFKHDYCEAPTQSLLQKWLREKHHLIIIVAYQYEHDSTPYSYWSYKESQSLPINQWVNYLKTYEEALEMGLQDALKLI